jgi:serine/threonine-protein kinase
MLGETVGQYRIVRLIGSGGMGAVYAAEHALLGRPAAVKVLLPEYSQKQAVVSRFFNEARAATAIRHVGIVDVLDFGWHSDGSAYIVMELLEGETLRDRMAAQRLPWRQALALARQIATALKAAHDKGIVHRDLKPDNVFLVPDSEVPGGERIKLLDFGIAKLAGDTHPGDHKTRTGSVMGTPTYMAPEQCRGVSVDQRADLYSLGCILFELAAGRPPFVGEGSGDVLAAHIHVAPPLVRSLAPDCPAKVEDLIQRLLAKPPPHRLQSANEVIDIINGILDSGGLDAATVKSDPLIGMATPVPTTLSGAARDKTITMSKPPRSWRIPVIAVSVIAAGIAGFLVMHSSDDDAPAKQPVVAATTSPPASTSSPAPTSPSPSNPSTIVAPSTPSTSNPSPPSPSNPSTTSDPADAKPTTVAVTLDSKPSSADVLLDGKRLGKTPFHGDVPVDRKLVVRLAKHRDKVIVLHQEPLDTTVTLDPLPHTTTKSNTRDQSVNPFGK